MKHNITTKNGPSYTQVFVNGEYYFNLYSIQEGFGHNEIKEGEYVINRCGPAIEIGFKSPDHSFPSIASALQYIDENLA